MVTETRLYRIWHDMKQRCYNPRRIKYPIYGGRGIRICEAWRSSFLAFERWAAQSGYRDDLSLDRIDVNGHYSPENCRWATVAEQSRNRRDNHNITVGRHTMCVTDWAAAIGQSIRSITIAQERGTPEVSYIMSRMPNVDFGGRHAGI